MSVEFQIMATEIVKSLRGAQTQMALSRQLGYKFNQVHRWETGITFPSWSDYVRTAKECQVEPTAQLRASLGYQGEAEDFRSLLLYLASNRNMSTIARLSRISRFSLGRWLHASSEPKFRDVLQLIAKLTPHIHETAQALAGGRQLTVTNLLTQFPKTEGIEAKPWLGALLVALDNPVYKGLAKHDSKVLAGFIRIDARDIKEGLADLKNASLIAKVNGKWEVTNQKQQDELSNGAIVDFYWIERVSGFYRRQSSASGGAQNAMIFNCSLESLIKIRQLFLQFCKEADAVVESDQSTEKRVGFLQYSQIFLDELPQADPNGPFFGEIE